MVIHVLSPRTDEEKIPSVNCDISITKVDKLFFYSVGINGKITLTATNHHSTETVQVSSSDVRARLGFGGSGLPGVQAGP